MRRRGDQSGFGTTVILLVVLVIAVLAVSSLALYQRHKPSNDKNSAAATTTRTTSQPQITTTTQTQQATAITTATHQAADGSFSFSYPSNWYINDSLSSPAAEDEINLGSVSAQSSNANAFRMSLSVVTGADAQPGYLPDGTVQKLTNGMNLWTSSVARSEVPSSPTSTSTMACPHMKIVSADEKHFSYPLKNGKFLILAGGYCQSDKDTTSQTYDQLLASQNWQAAVAIVQSIKLL